MSNINDIQRTGSISQDALRLGFQTTCNAGIERLLKIDDITKESCLSFKERHDIRVAQTFEVLAKRLLEDHERQFKNNMTEKFVPKNQCSIRSCLNALLKNSLLVHRLKKQSTRKIEISDIKVKEIELDYRNGCWRTQLSYKKKLFPWCGYYKGSYTEFKEEIETHQEEVRTDGLKCQVDYIAYDDFHDNYIPDDAAQAAFEAISIGMTKLMVAKPKVNRVNNQRDPIIIGHVGNQMFIIAWFGYDKKNHMSCNV